MAEEIVKLTVKIPTWRIRAARVAVFVLSPFVRTPEAGERIGSALFGWVSRGLKVFVDGKQV